MSPRDKRTRRQFLKATGATAGAVAIAGCSSGDSGGNASANGSNASGSDSGTNSSANGTRSTSEPNHQSSKTLTLIAPTLDTFDPIASSENASLGIIQQLFDGLTYFPSGDKTVKSLLATDYSVSKNAKTYTFSLQQATFHNGKSVTAADFVYSLERLAGSKHSQRSNYLLQSLNVAHKTDSNGEYVPGSLAAKATGEHELEVTLTKPFHAALELFAYPAFAAVPKDIVGDVPSVKQPAMPYQQFVTNPVGAGAFEFEQWQKGTEVSIKRFDNYWGQKASIKGVHWQIIEKDDAIYNYAMNRNADRFEMPTSKYDPSLISIEKSGPNGKQGKRSGTYGPVQNGATLDYTSIPLLGTYYIGFNMAAVPKPVRQAFAYVLHQELVTQEVFKGRGVPAYYLTPPSIYPGGTQAATQHAKKQYPYGYNKSRISAAQSVMEKAGYSQDNTYTVQWTQYQDSSWLEIAHLLQDQLRQAHINMKIQQAPFSAEVQRGENGQLEAYTLGWTADWPQPDNFLQLLNPPLSDTSKSAPLSFLNWNDETGSAAKQAIQAQESISANYGPSQAAQKKRNAAYRAIEDANWEDVGILPIYNILSEMFTYNGVDVPQTGSMGSYLQKFNTVEMA